MQRVKPIGTYRMKHQVREPDVNEIRRRRPTRWAGWL